MTAESCSAVCPGSYRSYQPFGLLFTGMPWSWCSTQVRCEMSLSHLLPQDLTASLSTPLQIYQHDHGQSWCCNRYCPIARPNCFSQAPEVRWAGIQSGGQSSCLSVNMQDSSSMGTSHAPGPQLDLSKVDFFPPTSAGYTAKVERGLRLTGQGCLSSPEIPSSCLACASVQSI